MKHVDLFAAQEFAQASDLSGGAPKLFQMKRREFTEIFSACLLDRTNVILGHRRKRKQKHFVPVIAEVLQPTATVNVASVREVTDAHVRLRRPGDVSGRGRDARRE